MFQAFATMGYIWSAWYSVRRSACHSPTSEIKGVALETTGWSWRPDEAMGTGLDTPRRLILIDGVVEVRDTVAAQEIEEIPPSDA